MILLLLFPVLVLGEIVLQTNVSYNVTLKDDGEIVLQKNISYNVTLKDGGEIGLRNNVLSNVTSEDDEHFQDQEHFHAFHNCKENLLKEYSNILCWNSFHIQMENISKDHWCNWDKVISIYNDVTKCMEEVTMFFSCYYPNQVVQDFFVTIHSQYFQACPSEEDMFPDAPSDVVLTLTLIPVCLIPFMVFLVVWKNKALD